MQIRITAGGSKSVWHLEQLSNEMARSNDDMLVSIGVRFYRLLD